MEEEYTAAYENRIGLLYLLALPENMLMERLRRERVSLIEREEKTKRVMARICAVLNRTDFRYVIFKTVRPFPFTPNDIDVLFVESRNRYKEAVAFLIAQGYRFHGIAPLQTLVYDLEGIGKVGKTKEGGIYYIDLYHEAGADYFAYLDKEAVLDHRIWRQVNGVEVPVPSPELELAVLLFHDVFPENTYFLEHFYLLLFYLYGPDPIDLQCFKQEVVRHHFVAPVRANLTITARLHELAFGFVPERLGQLLLYLGKDKSALGRFDRSRCITPHQFSYKLFFKTPIAKLAEKGSFVSFMKQCFHMLNPRFLSSVIRGIYQRVWGEGTYKQS